MAFSVYDDNKRECCGCSACEQSCPVNAVTMTADSEGFLYPAIDEGKCINCGLCKKICAFQNGTEIEDKREPKVYAVKAKDDIRSKSSSGGIFTLLSDEVLKKGGVVYGVVFDDAFKPVHIRADSTEKRDLCRGSKYSQSELGDSFRKIKDDLKNGVNVMFTGTSCQCAALNKYLDSTDREKLTIVDIICHGVPSPKLFSEYLGFVKRERNKDIADYYHRSKDAGWGHNEKIVYTDNSSEIKTVLADAWKSIFYTNAALRPACYNCKYTTFERVSDITIADFWGIEMFDKSFDDGKGVSLVITSTGKGEKLFDAVSGKTVFTERKLEEAAVKNPNLVKPSQSYVDRDRFWQDYKNGGIELITKKYGQYNFIKKVKRLIKRMLGRV